jgi:two-component system sensor histidine kinase CiaH
MIRRLRHRFVSIVMAVVTLILVATFLTILITTQRNNVKTSTQLLYQAVRRPIPIMIEPPLPDDLPLPRPPSIPVPDRRPVLILSLRKDGAINVVTNQLHFISDVEVESIVQQVISHDDELSVLQNQRLRCLREDTDDGVIVACADISQEQQMLRSLVVSSLGIGSLALVIFFILSIKLAHWAVHPIQVAWEQQEQFITNASHELKTPLTVILTNAELLGNDVAATDAKNARRIEHIQVEASRMKHLIEAMLTLARLDNTLPYSHTKTDWSYIVKSAVLMHEDIIYTAGKQLLYDIEDQLYIQGDERQLNQVVEILLDNACKYTAANGVVSVSLCRGEHKTALLTVSNSSEPIPKEELANIFLRFYRRDKARGTHGSFGLGLAIAQKIVEEHKGRIWADSDGQSTNYFYVLLPLSELKQSPGV